MYTTSVYVCVCVWWMRWQPADSSRLDVINVCGRTEILVLSVGCNHNRNGVICNWNTHRHLSHTHNEDTCCLSRVCACVAVHEDVLDWDPNSYSVSLCCLLFFLSLCLRIYDTCQFRQFRYRVKFKSILISPEKIPLQKEWPSAKQQKEAGSRKER